MFDEDLFEIRYDARLSKQSRTIAPIATVNTPEADASSKPVTKAEKADTRPKSVKILLEILSWFAWIAGALILALFINNAIIVNAVVISGSMEGTIQTNDRVLGLRTAYWFSSPRRFDVIVFNDPNFPDSTEPPLFTRMTRFATNIFRSSENRITTQDPFVKRIVGLPGETVQIINGIVYINGEPLEGDNFYSGITSAGIAAQQIFIPEGYFFVLGDNRSNSQDSRNWGLLNRREIIGRIYFSVWPNFNGMGSR